MKQFIKYCLLTCLFACGQTPPPPAVMEQVPTPMSDLKELKEITSDGKIILADGDTLPIPHYGSPEYLILYLVRHCEKDNSLSDNPPLTAEGVARAERLGRLMDNAVIDKITSTNTKRTMDTALAVKRRAGDPPLETFPIMAINDWLVENLATGGGQRVFHVGHQNTVPYMLNELTQSIRFRNIPDHEFGRFYIAITKGTGQTEVIELKY